MKNFSLGASNNYVVTLLSSPEEVAFLSERGYDHHTSISKSVKNVVSIVTQISDIFVVLTLALAGLLLLAVFVLVIRLLHADRVTIALLKSAGYASRTILSLELWKIVLSFIFSAGFALMIYPLATFLLNERLTRSFDAKIHLSILEAKTLGAMLAFLLVSFFLASVFALYKSIRGRIISLLS